MNFFKLFKTQKIPFNLISKLILITTKSLSSSSESDNRSVEPMQSSTNPVVISPDYLADFPDFDPNVPYDPFEEILNLNIGESVIHVLHEYDEPIPPISSSENDEVDSSTSGTYIMNVSYSFLTASDPSPHAMFEEIRHHLEKDEDVDREFNKVVK